MSRGAAIHAVVMAGGAGERFWPKSRRRRPKPLLRAPGGGTLLGATLERAARFAGPDRTWVVCAAPNARAIRAETDLPRGHVLVEPTGRDTAMAVGLAAARIEAEDPEAVLAVLPADHVVPDARAFAAAIRRAARAATGNDVLVTLGVEPTRPEPGYGYIEVGPPAGERHPGLFRVRRFVEKPSAARARGFLRRDDFLWNAGIFVWRARVVLEEIDRCAPELARALAPVRARPRGHGSRAARERAYRRAPSLPIDVAVLERSRRVWTLPVRFHWNDVGSWASYARELGVRAGRSRVVEGAALLEDAPGNLVWAGGRQVALLGVEGLVVVDTPDALLVADLERTPELKRLVRRLRAKDLDELL